MGPKADRRQQQISRGYRIRGSPRGEARRSEEEARSRSVKRRGQKTTGAGWQRRHIRPQTADWNCNSRERAARGDSGRRRDILRILLALAACCVACWLLLLCLGVRCSLAHKPQMLAHFTILQLWLFILDARGNSKCARSYAPRSTISDLISVAHTLRGAR